MQPLLDLIEKETFTKEDYLALVRVSDALNMLRARWENEHSFSNTERNT